MPKDGIKILGIVLSTSMDRFKIFRCFHLRRWAWAAAALTWADGDLNSDSYVGSRSIVALWEVPPFFANHPAAWLHQLDSYKSILISNCSHASTSWHMYGVLWPRYSHSRISTIQQKLVCLTQNADNDTEASHWMKRVYPGRCYHNKANVLTLACHKKKILASRNY